MESSQPESKGSVLKTLSYVTAISLASYVAYKTYNFLNYDLLNPLRYKIPDRPWKKLNKKTMDIQRGHLTRSLAASGISYKLNVVSYNILADAYTGLSSLSHHKGKNLAVLQNFDFRSKRIIMELQHQAKKDGNELPHILCFQEVDHFRDFYNLQLSRLGYDMELHWRKGIDAELVAWRKDKFKLEKCVKINHEDLIPRYGEWGKYFKRGNVGVICLLKHKETKSHLLVVNTHLYWNPTYDYVKYGQTFWLLFQIQKFLKENNLSMDTLPVIVCGDFNSKPNNSAVHLMMNKPYLLSESRTDPKTGTRAYRKQKGVDVFKIVDKDFQSHKHLLKGVLGRFGSSYQFYNENEFMAGVGDEPKSEKELEAWAQRFLKQHPSYSSYVTGMISYVDYIFFNPSAMRVTKLLELPDQETVEFSRFDESKVLPSEFFPSDHIRVQTEFEVFTHPKSKM